MPQHQPRVSIVLPTYNGARYLHQSVQSCLEQTYSAIELLIIDDGSVDQTPQIIKSFTDPRLVYHRFDKNQGHISALNFGFKQAKGALLTWTSDDNYYHPRAIERMMEYLNRRPTVDFVYTRYSLVDEQGRVLRSGRIRSPRELDEDNCVGGCFLYRRCVYEALGDYNPEAFLAEDYEYWLRVRKNFLMHMIDEDLYFYREHSLSLTGVHKADRVQKKVEEIRDRYIAAYKKHYFHGRTFFYAQQHLEAKNEIAQSLRLNPWFMPSWRLWALLHLSAASIEKVRALKQVIKR